MANTRRGTQSSVGLLLLRLFVGFGSAAHGFTKFFGEHGYTLVGPGEGWLACRSIGPGQMAEPTEILETISAKLKSQPPKKR